VHAIVDAVEPMRAGCRGAAGGIIPTIAPYLLPTLLVRLRDEAPT
jgi:hypothetical protein